MTTTLQRTGSKKLRALQTAYGKPWETIVKEWEESPLSQTQIASRWTALVQDVAPGMRFHQQDVHRAFRRVRSQAPAPCEVA